MRRRPSANQEEGLPRTSPAGTVISDSRPQNCEKQTSVTGRPQSVVSVTAARADKTVFLSRDLLGATLLLSAGPGPVRWGTPEGRAGSTPQIQVPLKHFP